MSFNLTRAARIVRVSNAAGAAQTAVNSTGVDTKSFRSITFLVLFGTIDPSAVTTCKLQQSSDDGSLDAYSDLTGTSIAVADDDDNQVVALEVDEPLKRYVRCVVSRGTADAVVDGIVALQYNADSEPVAHDSATCVGSEYRHAPAESTA